MNRLTYIITLLLITTAALAQNDSIEIDSTFNQAIVYKYSINREIGSTSWVHTQNAFKEANKMQADMVLLHLNTYGGQVVFADSIRTKILNSKIPVHVFIDNNAASAGALISVACDSIYMRAGANIGAATVVNQSGEKMPDKYQSYMRSTIRATAEAHGKDTIVNGQDTTYIWRRDPHIAEAMVDESIYIAGIIDTGKILTFTTLEAIEHGFCEGQAENVKEVIEKLGYKEYQIVEFKPSFYSGIKGFLTNPVFHGILILVIIGGLYFELQSPGIGFPLLASAIAAILYFAPLYIDGLAANWEIIIFVLGIVLIALEIFVIPGFGIAGVSGIILVFTGLTLGLVDNVVFDFSNVPTKELFLSLIIVSAGTFLSFIIAIPLSQKLFTTGPLAKVALQTTQDTELGYISVDAAPMSFIGEIGTAETTLRPSGKVVLKDEIYDAVAEIGMIDKGDQVKVIRYASGQLYVVKHG
ncbi:NfeD family protein [Labilibacter marinus]|uniref:NfeD family protein n=1 Tax=Labilibacter marinus TaxID=1477105 RepID=UPI0008357DF8|nr:NfeD family protein [Labilibacter marinus]